AAALLRQAHDAGLAVVLATSAPADELDAVRHVLDADDAIDAVTTSDDVEASKPAPDTFCAALRAGCVDSARALVIGDSVWDIQAARAAGLGCVAVESGGFSQHELSEAGAVHVYRDVDEIVQQLHTGPLATLIHQAGDRAAAGGHSPSSPA
ncbi:MAG: HAD-IA family hydrolase, partial [Actinomycetota bacterium]|nr:HAD-IA family hydrolase [Actinomycetota bacterium]